MVAELVSGIQRDGQLGATGVGGGAVLRSGTAVAAPAGSAALGRVGCRPAPPRHHEQHPTTARTGSRPFAIRSTAVAISSAATSVRLLAPAVGIGYVESSSAARDRCSARCAPGPPVSVGADDVEQRGELQHGERTPQRTWCVLQDPRTDRLGGGEHEVALVDDGGCELPRHETIGDSRRTVRGARRPPGSIGCPTIAPTPALVTSKPGLPAACQHALTKGRPAHVADADEQDPEVGHGWSR